MKNKKRQYFGKYLLIIGTIVICLSVCFRYIHLYHSYTAKELGIVELKSPYDADRDGIDDYTDILEGARAYIGTRPPYKSEYYLGGYPTDGYGVCTDVIWRAFFAAGYDLKSMVDQDIRDHPEAYPKIERPDTNIDFRRVRNLKIFFERHSLNLSTQLNDPQQWQAGDIVVFDGHIAICSDKRNSKGFPFILHHGPIGAREANEIENYPIFGHFRWSGKMP